MSGGKRASLLLFLVAALSCLGCDQLTKDIARNHLVGSHSASLGPGTVELALAHNSGAFLSLGAALPESARRMMFVFGVPLLLGALCLAFLWQPGLTKGDALALALVVGGGAGNWVDRLLQDGAVTDFVRIGIGPLSTGIFNVADVAIMAGVALMLLNRKGEAAAEPDAEGGEPA